MSSVYVKKPVYILPFWWTKSFTKVLNWFTRALLVTRVLHLHCVILGSKDILLFYVVLVLIPVWCHKAWIFQAYPEANLIENVWWYQKWQEVISDWKAKTSTAKCFKLQKFIELLILCFFITLSLYCKSHWRNKITIKSSIV